MLFIPVSGLLAVAMSELSPCIIKYIFRLVRELLLQEAYAQQILSGFWFQLPTSKLQIWQTHAQHKYDTHHNFNHANMPNSTTQAWTRDEVERLISWVENNQEQLRGKQIVWHKEVKE